MARLVVRTGRNAGAEFKLGAGRHIIGRRSLCHIPIADVKSSREHAALIVKDGDFFVQDLSRNGTLINGLAASRAETGSPLKFGDKIRIGDTTLELVDEKQELAEVHVPGYDILERIGSGGMGTVFKSRQLSMDRVVALKALNERYSANSEFVDRFIREARAAGKLNHPNVIHVHDIFHANGRHYFSMEFVDGSTVKEILRIEQKIDFKKVLDIVLQCARALEFAHENHIIHRDIKPDNIMLTREGIVKIADLGIAKTFEEAAPSAKQQRRVMGTPHYMAPEQALGKAIDHRVDIYSLGATFYHMLTGSTPFSGNTAHEILKAHIQESLPPIQHLNPGVPDPVCFIIERMMAKLPEKRYASMGKLIEDIERVQAGVAAGIDRIPAGDSTVMQALKLKAEGEDGAAGGTAEDAAVTGPHSPTRRFGLALALLLVFALTAAGVILLIHRLSSSPPSPADSHKHEGVIPPPVRDMVKSNPAAKSLLAEAIAAQERKDAAAYEDLLKKLVASYPTSTEAEEANKRLEELAAAKKEEEKQRVMALLDEAKKFAAANQEKLAECLEKYRAVAAAAVNVPEALKDAKACCGELEKRQAEELAKQNEAAWKAAGDAVNEQLGQGDYDAARATLNDFTAKNPNCPQKDTALQRLDKVNEEAQARFKAVKDKAAGAPITAALTLWDAYAAQVKDSLSAKELQTEREALDDKAHKLVEEKLKDATEKAKKYQYQAALRITGETGKSIAGFKYADDVKRREEDFKKQKDIYDRMLAAIQEAVKAGPVSLAFPLTTKLHTNTDVKWRISKLSGDNGNEVLELSSIDENVPGIPMQRIYDLTPAEQYALHIQFLGPNLKPADHEALAVFCRDRELTKEQEQEEKKAKSQ